jgi:hypothetical protein
MQQSSVLLSLLAYLLQPQFMTSMRSSCTLQGLIASIGCIDNSLSKAASNALIGLLSGKGASAALLLQVLSSFLGVWEKYARSSRLATPILKTAHLLLSRTGNTRLCETSLLLILCHAPIVILCIVLQCVVTVACTILLVP